MTVPFQLQDNVATLVIDAEGYKVTITVQLSPASPSRPKTPM
jgi:hypothetical protein